jgi:hypothetical protein
MLAVNSGDLDELAATRGLSGHTFWRGAKVAHSAVDFQTDITKKINLVCNELAILRRAVSVEPQNSRYLVSWANVRQLLGQNSCPSQDALPTSYGRAIEMAVEGDPNNPSVLYSAGLIYLWDADGNNARRLFRRFLLAGPRPSDAQVEVILSSISSIEDLNAVLPGRFPQIVQWSKVLGVKFADETRFQAALGELQSAALDVSKKEVLEGGITAAIYRDRLVQLRFISATDAVRRNVDSELGELYIKNLDKRLGMLFARLGQLGELSVVRARSDGDSRPNRSSLTSWGADGTVAFDSKYQSVGAYVSGKRLPKILLLTGGPGVSARDPSLVKVLVSSDNSSWLDITDSSGVYAYQFEDRPIVMIDVAGFSEEYPYWKVTYGSGADDPRIVNNLSQILRIYG